MATNIGQHRKYQIQKMNKFTSAVNIKKTSHKKEKNN